MDELSKKSYYYDLPQELIAQQPIEPRDNSRLLVFERKSGKIEHKHFFNILDYLKTGDVLVVNNSRVLPGKLFAIKEYTKAKIEVLLHKRINLKKWEIILRPFKRVQEGTKLIFNSKLSGIITKKFTQGLCEIEFEFEGIFENILEEIGNMPLPHYIHEKLKDKERYQTVYSKEKGSSAAPTAGLHFTQDLLQKIRDKGVIIVEVLLHVGLGTFRPVKEDNILSHKIHSEFFYLSEENAEIINRAKDEGRRVIAVGTTSVRVLETCARNNNLDFAENFRKKILSEEKKISEEKIFHVNAQSGFTDIFIFPPYKFKIVDALITNFHLPESTLIMLVSAFCGIENTMKMYKTAIEEKYRFFSFGDACLIL